MSISNRVAKLEGADRGIKNRFVWSYVAEASEPIEQIKARFRAEHPDRDPDSDDVLLIIRRLVAPQPAPSQ
jgi:hypothetical protein